MQFVSTLIFDRMRLPLLIASTGFAARLQCATVIL
jgi:hypothetical protein